MSFSNSLSEFNCLSELYRSDAPDTVLLAEYPSSTCTETKLTNRQNYIIHDPYPPPPIKLIKYLGPHHLMCNWGKYLCVSSEIKPDDSLLHHWQTVIGETAVPEWKALNNTDRYITLFPHESLDSGQQEINPAVLYELHSKQIIAEVNCPQASVLTEITYPCVLKLSHGYAGLGNFFIRTAEDEEQTKAYINTHWPDAQYVINSIIENIIHDYCVQFYLSKDNHITWLGFTNQIFDASGKWSGGTFVLAEQDEMYAQLFPFAQKTGDYLHSRGYHGIVGIDILGNHENDLFLIDVNPRLNGSTPFLTLCRHFLKNGSTSGLYVPSLEFPGTLAELVKRAEKYRFGKVVILSAYEAPDGSSTKCHLSVHTTSLADCHRVMKDFLSNQ